MDIVAQSLALIVLVIGAILLVLTISATIVIKTVSKQGKSLVQVICGERRKKQAKHTAV